MNFKEQHSSIWGGAAPQSIPQPSVSTFTTLTGSHVLFYSFRALETKAGLKYSAFDHYHTLICSFSSIIQFGGRERLRNNPRHRVWSYKQRKKIERTENWRNGNERKILEFNELWSSFLLLVMLAARKLCTHDEKTPEKRDGRLEMCFVSRSTWTITCKRSIPWMTRKKFRSIEFVWRSEISRASFFSHRTCL